MRALPIIAVAALLSGCAGITPATPNYASLVGMIQTDYPLLKAAAAPVALADPKAGLAIAAAEKIADPVVVALSASSSPLTIAAALQDAGVLLTVPGLPISAQTRADVAAGLAMAPVLMELGGS